MRNNEKRLGLDPQDAQPEEVPQTPPPPIPGGMSYVTPTEFVELPSKGLFYPENHPLCGKDVVEIKFMTAKEEDILTSSALLRRGIAIDRLIDSLLLNKRITSDSLLSGDRNAIIVAARKSAFGQAYETRVTCPSCGSNETFIFDLEEGKMSPGGASEDVLNEKNVQFDASTKLFYFELPKTKVRVGLRLLNGEDENKSFMKNRKKSKDAPETNATDQLRAVIVSVNGDDNNFFINSFIGALPISDSKYLKEVYSKLVPNIDLTQTYACEVCGHVEDMEVPFNTEFFWPDG